MNVYKQVTESSKKMCFQLESYKHREFLPSDANKIVWKVQHLAEQAGKENLDEIINLCKFSPNFVGQLVLFISQTDRIR